MRNNTWHDMNGAVSRREPVTINSLGSLSNRVRTYTESYGPASDANAGNPLVKLSEGKFLPPAGGVDFNEKCKVRVKVEYLDESVRSMKRVTFILFSIFKGRINNLCCSTDSYEKDGYAEAEMTMYYPPDHKGNDESAEYFFKVSHGRAEKELTSEKITIPYRRMSEP